MRIPRFVSPAAIPDSADLPAVAATRAQGFLSESAAVARFGSPSDAEPYLLLRHEQRSRIRDSIPTFENIHDRLPGDHDRYAVLRPNGQKGLWYNGESLWVSVAWLLSAEPHATNHTHGSRMVFALAHQCGV